MMGAHRLLAKCVMFEEAIRVPLMVRLPGQRVAHRIARSVSQIDIVPTLLDLLDAPVPDRLPGKSLRPCLEAGEEPPPEPVFIEWNGTDAGLPAEGVLPDWVRPGEAHRARASFADPVRTVVTPDGWKFNCSPLGEHELYHLARDPYETRNVFGEERSRARALRETLARRQKRTGDTVPLPVV